MGTFICSISERDWETAREKGIYGNKLGNLKKDGTYQKFPPKIRYSIIRDLVGMRKGDKIFFHVIRKWEPSTIHGYYVVRETPFYDETKIWDDPVEIFPYRFLFEPHPDFRYLCEKDASIEVLDFYELIEQRKIWSLATLENEINIEARSVRKIEERTETQEILRLLYRDFRKRRDFPNIQYSLIKKSIKYKLLRDLIGDIGRFENSIKALLMYKLGQNDVSLIRLIGEITDFMNEVFIAQTTRKCIDILCIRHNPDGSKKYLIIEVKTDKVNTNDLKQLLHYMDLFKLKELVNINSDIVDGCLIGRSFKDEVIAYSKMRNSHNINGQIILIKYEPTKNNTDAEFERIA